MSRHDEFRTKEETHLGGPRYRYRFPNAFGASVVKNAYSYGGDAGLWEVAVLGRDGALNYDTPVTDDVIGYLTDEQVDEVLDQIKALPEEVAA